MFVLDMLNKDKVFRQIIREIRSEFSSFEYLRIVPQEVYINIVIPIMNTVCNKHLGGPDVYYSFDLERAAHDKSKDRIELEIGLYIKESDPLDWFKRYKFSLSFQGSGK